MGKMTGMIAGMLMVGGIAVFAVDPQARMDVNTGNKIVLKPGQKPAGGSLDNPGWAKENKDKMVSAHSAKLKSDDWEEFVITFTPEADGDITISLMGMWYREKGADKNTPVWVLWDEVKVEGAAADVVNGDFEKVDASGKVAGWSGKPERFVEVDGNKCVKVSHDERVSQRVKVVKDQEVTVKAKIKKGE